MKRVKRLGYKGVVVKGIRRYTVCIDGTHTCRKQYRYVPITSIVQICVCECKKKKLNEIYEYRT